MINKSIEGLFQLSDTHILPEGEMLSGSIDTAVYLRQAVRQIMKLSHKPGAVAITGDLVERPSVEAYQQFRQILSELDFPFYLLIGNHDHRENFLEIFPEYLEYESVAKTGFIQYAAEIGGVQLIALDTQSLGHSHGSLCAQRLAWLEETLSLAPQRPTMIAMHHPPFCTGIAHMDECSLESGREEFQKIIARHPQVQRVICGHVHRLCISPFAKTVGVVCPSAAHQIAFQLDLQKRNAYTLEPAAGLMHIWSEEESGLQNFHMVSHVLPFNDFEGPFHF